MKTNWSIVNRLTGWTSDKDVALAQKISDAQAEIGLAKLYNLIARAGIVGLKYPGVVAVEINSLLDRAEAFIPAISSNSLRGLGSETI